MSTTKNLENHLRQLEERIKILEVANNEKAPLNHDNNDPIFNQAVIVITGYDHVSASLLQRRFGIGYARASRLLDELEAGGYVEPADGTKPRRVIKKRKALKQNIPFLSLLSETYKDGAIPYKWLLKMYDSSGLDYKLPVIIGINETGKVQFTDLYKAPHVLIGGATGSGKTVFLFTLISTLLYHMSPEKLRLIIIDSKRVEMPQIFENLPHLLTNVVVEPEKALKALRWTVAEMENRYKRLAEAGVRNIDEYNKLKKVEKIPYILLIIDELADLMIFAPKDMENHIIRLAQLSRATGIHLVLSTQRPSNEVMTPMMKANIPTRIAFNVSSKHDSKVILDMLGAETLRGNGDLLFLPPDMAKPIRIQAAFIEDDEMSAIVQYIIKSTKEGVNKNKEDVTNKTEDNLLSQAITIIQQFEKASASLLQRHLSIGYARAAHLLDQLEAQGYVGPADGVLPRKVLKH